MGSSCQHLGNVLLLKGENFQTSGHVELLIKVTEQPEMINSQSGLRLEPVEIVSKAGTGQSMRTQLAESDIDKECRVIIILKVLNSKMLKVS